MSPFLSPFCPEGQSPLTERAGPGSRRPCSSRSGQARTSALGEAATPSTDQPTRQPAPAPFLGDATPAARALVYPTPCGPRRVWRRGQRRLSFGAFPQPSRGMSRICLTAWMAGRGGTGQMPPTRRPKGSLGLRQSHAPDKSHHSTADRGGAAKATSPADRPLGARAGEAREAAGAGLRDARGDTALTARHRRALASVVLTSASRNLTDDTRTPQVTGINHLLPRPSKATKAHRVSSERETPGRLDRRHDHTPDNEEQGAAVSPKSSACQ